MVNNKGQKLAHMQHLIQIWIDAVKFASLQLTTMKSTSALMGTEFGPWILNEAVDDFN